MYVYIHTVGSKGREREEKRNSYTTHMNMHVCEHMHVN